MRRENWVWMPHAGHFILGDKCKFHLNTYVGSFVVSTVGELWNDGDVRKIHAKIFNPKWYVENKHLLGDSFDNAYMKEFGYEDVGYRRKYETMVFRAKKCNSKCCPYTIIVKENVDSQSYNKDEDAYVGHMQLCEKWSKHD